MYSITGVNTHEDALTIQLPIFLILHLLLLCHAPVTTWVTTHTATANSAHMSHTTNEFGVVDQVRVFLPLLKAALDLRLTPLFSSQSFAPHRRCNPRRRRLYAKAAPRSNALRQFSNPPAISDQAC
jgi:hypothetical protein